MNIDLQKKILIELKYDYIIIFNVLEHLLDPNLALRNLSKICKKMEKLLDLLHFYLGFMEPKRLFKIYKRSLNRIIKIK